MVTKTLPLLQNCAIGVEIVPQVSSQICTASRVKEAGPGHDLQRRFVALGRAALWSGHTADTFNNIVKQSVSFLRLVCAIPDIQSV